MLAPLNRRDFLGGAASASAAAYLVGGSTNAANAANAEEPSASAAIAPKTTKSAVDWPIWGPPEEAALLDVLNSGKWGRTSGGRCLIEFEAAFGGRIQARHCLATSSGTTALLTTLGALNIGPGDEVILPPYTFVATFNAITNGYALPIFVDSDAETFQIDPKKIASAITPNTKLIISVHIGGSPADLDAISAITKAHQIPMIEDACQAPLAELRGRPVGTTGIAGCFSFQASKNLTSGEGGAITTNDDAFADLCYNFHTPGGSRPSASPGRGANYRMTEFQAGVLLAQLSRFEVQSKTRQANALYLNEMLAEVPG
ncbi:MAG: DegT/DnrJ/EryC1/StrS family aminotransferase, partial [Isosphaeraceae bacterium]